MTTDDVPSENTGPKTVHDVFDFVSYTAQHALATGKARRWMIVDKKTRRVVDVGLKSKSGAIARAKKLQRELGQLDAL